VFYNLHSQVTKSGGINVCFLNPISGSAHPAGHSTTQPSL